MSRKGRLPGQLSQPEQGKAQDPFTPAGQLVFYGARWLSGYWGWGYFIRGPKALLAVSPLSFPKAFTPSRGSDSTAFV